MDAQYKDYAYGDNAKVLKNRVNNSPSPVSVEPKEPRKSKKPSTAGARSRAVASQVGAIPNSGVNPKAMNANTLAQNTARSTTDFSGRIDTSEYKDSPVGKFFASTGGLDDDARARLFPKKSIDVPQPVAAPSASPTTGGATPSALIGAQQQAGTSRFDKSKLTLGNNPYTGQVGMFKDGQMLDPSSVRLSGGNLGGTPLPAGQSPFFMKSQAAQGLVPQAGTASAIPGMQQNPAVGMPGGNWTGMLNQDDAIFKALMANVGNDYKTGTGNPAFASDPMMAQSLARRDSLQASLDTFNRQNPLRPGASVGDIISNRASTFTQRKELEDLNKDIFGRSDLGTKLQMAILDSLTKKDISQGDNQTALAKQAMENQGMWDTRSMMEGNENMRHLANLQAGVGQPKPGEDQFAKLTTDGMREYYKTMLANNPGMTEDDFVELLSSSSTKLKNKMSGNTSGIVKDRLGKY